MTEKNGLLKWLVGAGLVLVLIMGMSFFTGYALASWRPVEWANRLTGFRGGAEGLACPMLGRVGQSAANGASAQCAAQVADSAEAGQSQAQIPGESALSQPGVESADSAAPQEEPELLFGCH